jgi:probable F420-dependent oxidoreductase
MDFGVFLPVSGKASQREGLMHAVQKAEEFGFVSVWAADRIVIPWTIETPYNYNWSGSFFVPPEAPFLEPLTVLAFLAGCTEKLRLGISVLVGPYRDPVYWAKVVASIDYLSKGRFILGLGVGWMEEEFAALGRRDIFQARGRVADEQIAIARELFTREHCSFHGEFYDFEDIAFQPKAYDPENPVPFWIGGEAKPAQRRAGRVGDAWFPYFPRITPEELGSRYDLVRRTARDAGRDPDEVALNCCLSVEITEDAVPQEPDVLRGNTEQVAQAIQRFRDVGVGHMGLQFLVGRFPERLEQMERFSEDVLRPGVIS